VVGKLVGEKKEFLLNVCQDEIECSKLLEIGTQYLKAIGKELKKASFIMVLERTPSYSQEKEEKLKGSLG